MPNDFLSSSAIQGREPRAGAVPRQQVGIRRSWLAPILAGALLLAGGGCGSEDEGLTYTDDIRPIFGQRCAVCHREDGPSGVDIQNPYNTRGGLVNSNNRFAELNPSLGLPTRNVVPGDPDNSFLMYKIDPNLTLPADPDGAGPVEPPGGVKMPLQIPLLDCVQVHIIQQWVLAGAPAADEAFEDPGAPARGVVPATSETLEIPACPEIPRVMRTYRADIEPIFGTEADLDRNLDADGGVCTPGPNKPCARCIYCHYRGSTTPPDLTDAFNPVTGLVNAPARRSGNLMRVAPGNLEDSLLIQKLRYELFTTGFARSDYGAQMPYAFDELSRTQIETVRQWISEGAKP